MINRGALFSARSAHGRHVAGLVLAGARRSVAGSTRPSVASAIASPTLFTNSTRSKSSFLHTIPSSRTLLLRENSTSSLRTPHNSTFAYNASSSVRLVGLRHLFSRARRKAEGGIRYQSSSKTSGRSNGRNAPKNQEAAGGRTTAAKGKVVPPATGTSMRDKLLLSRLPDLSNRFHAPTKEELLAAATGFWSRLRVRFKWFSIRSLRPFNMDDISAFFSALLVGHVIWILVGTTTFFSLVIFTVNTVFAQETLASWVGSYLTKSSGVKVVFESAIVPKWKGGVITFKNVFVSRRPGQKQGNVKKGSPESAAAEAASAALHERALENGETEEEDTNYTQYDLSIDTVNVTLSFAKWFNGNGLLRDVEVKGVRGVIDRTSIVHPDEYIDPRAYKREHDTGDFELESFKLEDLLVSVYQPDDFRPFSVSIYSADLPQLRKQWLFYDMLSANHMSGSFDESLFTIHPRQTHNYTGARLNEDGEQTWKKQSRLRIDGLKIDHLNRGVEGPFSWIHEGNVDMVADIMFPADDDPSFASIVSDFYDRVEKQVIAKPASQERGMVLNNDSSQIVDISNSESASATSTQSPQEKEVVDNRHIILDLRVHLNSVHAHVPIFTRDLSYVNNALIRPIVAYINSHSSQSTFIPIHCSVVKRVNEFDGSWTIFDSGLMEDLSREVYDAFARDVVDDQARIRRIKKVGLWSLQLAIQALFLGLAGNVA